MFKLADVWVKMVRTLCDRLLQHLITNQEAMCICHSNGVTVIWILNKAIWLHCWVITHLSSTINLSPWPSTHSPLVSMEVELMVSRWGTPDWNQCPDHCLGNWQPPANRQYLSRPCLIKQLILIICPIMLVAMILNDRSLGSGKG
jgi:hypothetical protein